MSFVILAIIGLGGGLIVSAGEFALITTIGIMPRLAGKTHTGKYVRLYEDAVVLGGTLWNAMYVYQVTINPGMTLAKWGLGTGAIFAGMFIGCLAVSLAEALKATAIFSRRIKLSTGLSFIVLSAALGKMFGALIHFFVF